MDNKELAQILLKNFPFFVQSICKKNGGPLPVKLLPPSSGA